MRGNPDQLTPSQRSVSYAVLSESEVVDAVDDEPSTTSPVAKRFETCVTLILVD